MKKIILCCFLLLGASAQATTPPTMINQAHKGARGYCSESVSYGKIISHWSGISFGYNGLVSSLKHFDKPTGAEFLKQEGNSIGINLNMFDVELVSTRPFSVILGLGMELNTFRFSNNISLMRDDQGMVVPNLSYQDRGVTLSKTKLSTNYFVIPLLAEFRMGDCGNRPFFLHGGIIGGWMFNGHTKVKYEEGGRSHKDKNKDLALNRFRYGYTLGLGWANFGVFARYYPKSIFKNSFGPNVAQISMGIAFNMDKMVN